MAESKSQPNYRHCQYCWQYKSCPKRYDNSYCVTVGCTEFSKKAIKEA